MIIAGLLSSVPTNLIGAALGQYQSALITPATYLYYGSVSVVQLAIGQRTGQPMRTALVFTALCIAYDLYSIFVLRAKFLPTFTWEDRLAWGAVMLTNSSFNLMALLMFRGGMTVIEQIEALPPEARP